MACSLGGEPTLLRLVLVLQRDQHALERSEQNQRQKNDKRAPQQGMQPIRRLIGHLDEQRGADNDETRYQNDEHGGAVTRIGKAVVEAANIAARRQGQIAGEQLATTARRTAAGDPCGKGVLVTNGKLAFKRLELFGEHYDGGDVDFRFRWFDRDASYHAIELSAPNVLLRKGSGLILGSIDLRPGAKIQGNLVASDVPIGKIDALPSLLRAADGKASAVLEVSGTAQGGTLTLNVEGVLVVVATTAGQTAEEVAAAIADAINANDQLSSLGVAAVPNGSQVIVSGGLLAAPGVSDPGLAVSVVKNVPSLSVAALALLGALLAASGAWRSRLGLAAENFLVKN